MRTALLVLLLVLAPLASADNSGGNSGDNSGNTANANNAASTVPNPDPWMKMNRVTHKFNHFFDKILLRPAAVVYVHVVPQFARNGVRRFFENLSDVDSSLNSFLQGKPKDGITDLGRVLVNTTIGIGGLFDPATAMGMKDHDEDFGQTLAVWGIPRGPYLVLPFLGPSTVEDAFGRPFDAYADPLVYLYPVSDRNTLYVTRAVSGRAGLLAAESMVFGDEYIFYRDAYLQRRNYLIHDGKVKDTF